MKYIVVLTDPAAFLCRENLFSSRHLPHKYNNQLPDQLAFSIKSYTVCTKPELRVIEGIIVALRWFEVSR